MRLAVDWTDDGQNPAGLYMAKSDIPPLYELKPSSATVTQVDVHTREFGTHPPFSLERLLQIGQDER